MAIDVEPASELEAFFAYYAERYMASDVDAIGALYEAPLLALRDGQVIHLADRAEVREHLTKLMDAYARSGAVRADIEKLAVTELGRSSAFATVHWHVRDADGTVLKDFRTTYHLATAGGGRRILSYTNHDD